MTLEEVRQILRCEILCGEERLDAEVEECFAADLMSDVLAFGRPNALLVTGLTGIQSVHTADVADLSAIVFVLGKRPPPSVLDLARARNIPVMTTPHPLFEACGLLRDGGLKSGARA